MEEVKKTVDSIDAYIAQFPAQTRETLTELRQVISDAAPEAEEKISYQMPTFYFNGNLVHFAAFKNHIGFYPAPSGIEAFQEELSGYRMAKGTVRFPLEEPLPLALIQKIVAFRMEENKSKAAKKKKKSLREAEE